MAWRRPGRRALVAALTVVAALLPISLVAAVSAFAGGSPGGGNSGAGPAIVGFSPQEGSIAGGNLVHISGGGFAGVTGVSFGGHPARSFEVKSENLVDAVAPAVSHGINVRIFVEASGGAAHSNRDFTFVGCHVPQLRDERVAAARTALLAAGCKVGLVRAESDARAPLRVVAETPRAGLWLEPGAQVDLRVR